MVELRLASADVGTASVLAVGGEVDLATASSFEARLLEVGGRATGQLVVDLTGVSFMDSTGFNVLVAARRRLRPSGVTISLVTPDPQLRRLLALTGLDEVFPVHECVDAALPAT